MSGTSLPLIRPLAVPVEHGAWGFLLEPVVLGLLVAPSPAGALIGIGGVAVFLLRHPLKLAMHDWLHHRYPRTAVCEVLVAIYGLAALITFGAACVVAGVSPAATLTPLLIALPFAVIQFVYDLRKQNRTLIAELCGAIAPASLIASIILASGKPLPMAAAFSALVLARSIPAVLYVRSVLRSHVGRSSVRRDGLKPVPHVLVAHIIAVIVAAFVSWTSVVAMALLLARAIVPATGVRAQTIGLREIGWGICFIALSAA